MVKTIENFIYELKIYYVLILIQIYLILILLNKHNDNSNFLHKTKYTIVKNLPNYTVDALPRYIIVRVSECLTV